MYDKNHYLAFRFFTQKVMSICQYINNPRSNAPAEGLPKACRRPAEGLPKACRRPAETRLRLYTEHIAAIEFRLSVPHNLPQNMNTHSPNTLTTAYGARPSPNKGGLRHGDYGQRRNQLPKTIAPTSAKYKQPQP